MHFEEGVSLARFTTFHLGGSARFFCVVHTVEELRESIDFARDKHLTLLILGGGSNVLIQDGGFDGLVIKIELSGIELQKNNTGSLLVASAGESWDAVVERAVGDRLWGIENLSGIPGSVGAAPVQNIGAYGAELKDTLLWVEALNIESGEVTRLATSECAFGYRTSKFKKESQHWCVLRIALQLTAQRALNISYRDLAEALKDTNVPTGVQIREAVLAIRARKFPDLGQEGTAGSFFLNPIVSAEVAEKLKERFPELPLYPGENGVKVSLAWLLDHALHLRGFSVGGARLYEKQPIVIVAARGASASDVSALAEAVIEKVRDAFGMTIEREVQSISSK